MAGIEARLARAEVWSERAAVRAPATPLALAERAGFAADPWQTDVLATGARRLCLLCCRQSGKSTTSALLALHAVLSGGLCLVLSPTERQSAELVRKAKTQLRALGGEAAPLVAESTSVLEFASGGRLIALPGADDGHIRGYSGVDLLLIDEAARVSDDLYAAARPMLAVSGGRLVLLSTPWGKRGFFHETWDAGGPEWHRVKVTAHDCPRIDPAFLEEERRTLGDLVFRSEYLCEFVDTEESAFDSAEVLAALDPTVRPLFPAVAA